MEFDIFRQEKTDILQLYFNNVTRTYTINESDLRRPDVYPHWILKLRKEQVRLKYKLRK